ncbi:MULTISPECIES: helix-turn-helix transcriptional regulator [Pseudomonadaceae]|uniref:HTH luxR-type domain-containing protein n=2 Tax=Pseudomonadaceae TaxID=135621 RepID=A0A2R3QK14_ECTME|nr:MULTISPECIES: helix-turn-helix transcriptional regulator [Pseudomonas]AVO52084.1 hypothetical protein C7A17_04650 [Pseudomonas mendocina]QMV62336.1 helix-turn-helix transcriptional regulator [Pseudomonas berkeleyensis]WSO37779.1 helix-turn-helix transcriptional regulator [Pseudomonas berkeleyensis]
MSTMQTAKGDLLVREAMHFSRDFLGVSGALFYWVDRRRQEMQVLETLDVPPGFLEQYRRGMQPFDPMCVSRMLARHDSVGVLSIARESQNRAEMRHYQGYLDTYGVLDTVDLMFWGEHAAFGGIGFLRTLGDPPIKVDTTGLVALQRLLQASFSAHPHVRQLQLEQRLDACGLSVRERQVAALIGAGASNREIAEAMNITLATAKTYVVRIFEKLNIDSRTALVAFMGQLN